MKAFMDSKNLIPTSFLARLEVFIEEYVNEKRLNTLAKCCKRCKKKFLNIKS